MRNVPVPLIMCWHCSYHCDFWSSFSGQHWQTIIDHYPDHDHTLISLLQSHNSFPYVWHQHSHSTQNNWKFMPFHNSCLVKHSNLCSMHSSLLCRRIILLELENINHWQAQWSVQRCYFVWWDHFSLHKPALSSQEDCSAYNDMMVPMVSLQPYSRQSRPHCWWQSNFLCLISWSLSMLSLAIKT